jgi:argininosuccinate lyase
LKENYMEAIDTLKDNLEVASFMLEHVIVNQNCIDHAIYDYMYSVEEVNKLVMSGMTFRDAYKKLGTEIFAGDFNPDKKVNHSHEGSIGNLCLVEIKNKFEANF